MSSAKPSPLKSLIGFLAFATVLGTFFVLALLASGQKSGVEFCPHDFSRRRFSYVKLAWFDLVINKKKLEDLTSELETTLLADGFLPQPNTPKRWDLVADYNGSSSGLISKDCDARFLTYYLDLGDDDSVFYWLGWNERYPKCARSFWPIVAEMAQDQMYLRIPDLMEYAMANDQDNPEQFLNSIYPKLSDWYQERTQIRDLSS
ncbi:MAG: hypothetical protein AAF623_04020, partial [Planctomycetota bacterium]